MTKNSQQDQSTQAYLRELPMSDAQRAALHASLDAPGADADMNALHRVLGEGDEAASPARRLGMAYPELQTSGVLHHDELTGACIAAAPPVHRTSMVPEEPWVTNPLVRAWGRARGKAQQRRAENSRGAGGSDRKGWRATGHF